MINQKLDANYLYLASILIAVCLILTSSLNAQALPSNGRIVFQSDRDDAGFDIYTMNPDGSDVQRLTSSPSNEFEPVWSPDGSKIAFTSNREETVQGNGIYVMDADGSNEIFLTPSINARDPSWSPDGSRIAFTSIRDSQFGDIFVMDADGSNVTNLTVIDYPESEALLVKDPSWTPNNRILFVGTEQIFENTPGYDYYIMNSDGSNRQYYTEGAADLSPARISPDGNSLIFSAAIGSTSIFQINTDGTDNSPYAVPPRIPSTGDIMGLNPNWSPDGTKIVFSQLTLSNIEISVMASDGSNIVQLTNGGTNLNPDWQPIITTNQAPNANAGSDQTFTDTLSFIARTKHCHSFYLL